MILHGVMNIFVVPINAESDLTCKESTEESTEESKEEPKEESKEEPTEESKEEPTEEPTEKIKHCDIYQEMIRISINNHYNW